MQCYSAQAVALQPRCLIIRTSPRQHPRTIAELDLGCRMSVAAIAAAIMVARSPASAIAVCKELKAKGA